MGTRHVALSRFDPAWTDIVGGRRIGRIDYGRDRTEFRPDRR